MASSQVLQIDRTKDVDNPSGLDEKARRLAAAALRPVDETEDVPSIGLVTSYAQAPETLTDEQQAKVERWMERFVQLKSDVEEMRTNSRFYKGVVTTLSDV